MQTELLRDGEVKISRKSEKYHGDNIMITLNSKARDERMEGGQDDGLTHLKVMQMRSPPKHGDYQAVES